MESIIIFTNSGVIKRKKFGSFAISKNNTTDVIPVNNKCQFIIAYDGLTNEQLDDLVESNVATNAIYILHHRIPEVGKLKELKKKLVKKGINNEWINFKKSDHTTASTYGCLRNISENREKVKELQKVFNELKGQIYILPALIQLHKIIILERLKCESRNDAQIKIMEVDGYIKLRNAFNQLPEDVKSEGADKVLEYISNETLKYGV